MVCDLQLQNTRIMIDLHFLPLIGFWFHNSKCNYNFEFLKHTLFAAIIRWQHHAILFPIQCVFAEKETSVIESAVSGF